MSATEFPAPGPGARIDSRMVFNRARPVVLRNNIVLVAVTMSGGVFAAIMAAGMVMLFFSEFLPQSEFNSHNGWNTIRWAVGGLSMGYMCRWLWNLGRRMAGYTIRLDSQGVEFKLGTKKNPQNLFLMWTQIAAIKHRRLGNFQQYFVEGTDGSEASFSSYTFFRPRKVARLIAARAGQTIEEA